MNGLMYLLQVNLYLLLFYLFYVVLLRNETFFKMNRFYLVGSALLSLAIPLVKANWVKDLLITERVHQVARQVNSAFIETEIVNNSSAHLPENLMRATSPFSNFQILALIYGSITMLLLLNFLRKLFLLNRTLQSDSKEKAFSFFKKVVIDQELEGKETIINHEMVHVKQWHSLDVIFFEIFAAFNWFNPIAFLYKKAIKDIHEFIADETTAATLEDKSAYTLLLVSNVFGAKPQQLTNNFFNQSLLKRRIIMLHKTKSRQVAVLKYGLSVPLFALMVILSSATATAEKLSKSIVAKASPIISILSNAELQPINKVESPSFKLSVAQRNSSKPKMVKKSKVELSESKKKLIMSQFQNLRDYISNFKSQLSTDEPKYGVSYFSFAVDKNKKTSSFKVIKSVFPEWENELVRHLNAFTDTVSLNAGTYNFYKGTTFAFPGDNHNELLDKNIKTIFGFINSTTSIFTTKDEIKSEAGKIVNYVKVPYLTNPIILVDGKLATYSVAELGFKLDESIYPKNAKVTVLKGDKAVAAYNEDARKGLILIKTE